MMQTESKLVTYKMPFDMTVEEWQAHKYGGREYHEKWQAAMKNEGQTEHGAQHNQRLVNDTMTDLNCTELEAWASMELDTDSLEATQKAIATAVTHDRLLISLFPSNLAYLRNEYYKGQDVSEEFLQSEAQDMTEEQAWQFAHDWEQLDEYDTMTEAEVERVIFGTKEE